MPQDLTVANTILAQLGGKRFLIMTGAKNLCGDREGLLFSLPAQFAEGHRNKIRVKLTPMDTYTITWYWQRRGPIFEVLPVKEETDVYAEDLQRVFTAMTGLETHL